MSKNEDAMRQMTVQLDRILLDDFENVGMEAQRSIVEGSEITTAPGQPVDTGFEKGSWQRVYDSPTRQTIGTNAGYAEDIEDAIGPHGPRAYGAERSPALQANGGSTVGGSHSVKITVNGLQRILDVVAARRRK